MISATQNIRSLARRFRQEEEGAVTIAAVLWLPFFVAILVFVADLAMIFYGQARAQEVAENANRSLSVGYYSSYAEAEEAVRTALNPISPNVRATTTAEDYVIRTVVTIPTRDLASIGLFSSLASLEITAVAHMVQEF